MHVILLMLIAALVSGRAATYIDDPSPSHTTFLSTRILWFPKLYDPSQAVFAYYDAFETKWKGAGLGYTTVYHYNKDTLSSPSRADHKTNNLGRFWTKGNLSYHDLCVAANVTPKNPVDDSAYIMVPENNLVPNAVVDEFFNYSNPPTVATDTFVYSGTYKMIGVVQPYANSWVENDGKIEMVKARCEAPFARGTATNPIVSFWMTGYRNWDETITMTDIMGNTLPDTHCYATQIRHRHPK